MGFLLPPEPGRERAALPCAKSESAGNTALRLAVVNGDLTDAKGKSPLALGLEAGKFDMADLLLERGAKPLVKA